MGFVSDAQDDEFALDSAVPGVEVLLRPVSAPPAREALPTAPGFGVDEWAAQLPDGRVLAFLREPVARCHLDRLRLVDGERALERPLAAWIYYGHFLAIGPGGSLLIGGPRIAHRLDADGTFTTLLDQPDGDGVPVAWLPDGTAAAAGVRTIVLDGPGGRVELPCAHAVGACVVAPDLLVVSDDDGSQWIRGGRVVARDWRPFRDARGDVILSAAGDAYRVRIHPA
jgi:hypothetical protein